MRVGTAGQDHGAVAVTESTTANRKHGCCSVADALDARAVAARLGMPFYVLNFEPDFERIIDYFVDEYARARTPNPCIRCNIELKFGQAPALRRPARGRVRRHWPLRPHRAWRDAGRFARFRR